MAWCVQVNKFNKNSLKEYLPKLKSYVFSLDAYYGIDRYGSENGYNDSSIFNDNIISDSDFFTNEYQPKFKTGNKVLFKDGENNSDELLRISEECVDNYSTQGICFNSSSFKTFNDSNHSLINFSIPGIITHYDYGYYLVKFMKINGLNTHYLLHSIYLTPYIEFINIGDGIANSNNVTISDSNCTFGFPSNELKKEISSKEKVRKARLITKKEIPKSGLIKNNREFKLVHNK